MMRLQSLSSILAALTLLCPCVSNAQDKAESRVSESKAGRDARMAWWREAKFGMFVHWGVYSTTGGLYNGQKLPNSAEWMMARGKIPIAEYEKYAAQFNPTKFNADEFVGRAKRAGMKYLVITAKHHDGFSMFGSKCSDYKTFERNIPAQAPAGEDWEVCMPISGSWGYKIGDDDFKSTTTLIRNLIEIASMGGNYLLNVSPTGEGTLLPSAIERLEQLGAWMDINSESIYGTEAGPFANLEWGRCTRKESGGETMLYLHVYDWPADGKLLVPGLKNAVGQATLLDGGLQLQTESTDEGVTISLPAEATDEHASVVVLKVAGTLEVEANLPTVGADGRLVLTVE